MAYTPVHLVKASPPRPEPIDEYPIAHPVIRNFRDRLYFRAAGITSLLIGLIDVFNHKIEPVRVRMLGLRGSHAELLIGIQHVETSPVHTEDDLILPLRKIRYLDSLQLENLFIQLNGFESIRYNNLRLS
jgi:hypothetical protein